MTAGRERVLVRGVGINEGTVGEPLTVEFFNMILGTRLTAQEKEDLVTFLRAL